MPRVPRPLSGPSSRALNLTPPEAFLLSRVDALLDEDDLALVSGMTPAQVRVVLDRLASLGAIEIVDDGAPPGGRPAAQPSSPGGPSSRGGPSSGAPRSGPTSLRYDPAELDAPGDLEPERKKRVVELYFRLDEMTYYEVLGVARNAEKKAIKSAYYAIAPEFHPDKYFRKELGTWRPKIEAIFARMTLALDVLTTRERRAEYDEYLEQTSRNRAMSAVFEEPGQDVGAVLAAVEQAAAQALAEQERMRASTPASHPSSPRLTPPVPPQPSAFSPDPRSTPAISARPSTASQPAPSAEEILRQRREALARKLTAGRRPSGVMQSVPSPSGSRPAVVPMDPAVAERAAEAMRLRREAALADAKRVQLQGHLDAGRAALERGDYPAAVNAYRIAASLEPDDPKVQATCNEALQTAAAALADGYWKQAMYEEGQDRWSEAALSYAKVCTGKPNNAAAHERVAFATLKSGGSARRAVDFARKAIELDPRKPDYHVTLARAYGAAGLDKSAQGELDRALALAPKDPRVQALVGHAKTALSPKDGK